MPDLRAIGRRLDPSGLIVRGGFHPAGDDGVPGNPGTLVLIGNAGPAMWRAFARQRRDEPDPLDAWTRRTLEAAAAGRGAAALLPFQGPPWLPFQRWAMRAEAVHRSPIGPLIHPEYGLWHAYRGALAFAGRLALPAVEARPSPCDGCRDRPCLATCPVGALSAGGYDVPACVGHIAQPAGTDCLETGCRARRACPVGRAYIYERPQATFHMTHFLRAQRKAG